MLRSFLLTSPLFSSQHVDQQTRFLTSNLKSLKISAAYNHCSSCYCKVSRWPAKRYCGGWHWSANTGLGSVPHQCTTCLVSGHVRASVSLSDCVVRSESVKAWGLNFPLLLTLTPPSLAALQHSSFLPKTDKQLTDTRRLRRTRWGNPTFIHSETFPDSGRKFLSPNTKFFSCVKPSVCSDHRKKEDLNLYTD